MWRSLEAGAIGVFKERVEMNAILPNEPTVYPERRTEPDAQGCEVRKQTH